MTADDDNDSPDNVVRVDFAAKKQKPKQPDLSQPQSSSELSPDRPEKLRVFARLIERGMVMVTTDARRNARVPAKFAGELQLNLNFSHKFGVADFFYDDDGVRCSLSFQGQAFFCDLPWTAVWGLTSHADGERVLWPDSLPEELRSLLPAQARHPTAKDDDGDDPPPPAPKPTLRRIK
ncbi:MAG: hypothetical protein Q8O67_20400 [Deltaproteobacteria bacterium]|nr:hypothetical protein [Deltaproteobacteria bacterium]